MNNKLLFYLFTILLVIFFIHHPSDAENKKIAKEDKYVKNEIIIKFKEGIQPDKKLKVLQKHNLKEIKKKVIRKQFTKVEMAIELDERDLIKKLKENPEVEYAELNYITKVCSVLPNDEYFNKQWGIQKIEANNVWSANIGNTNIIIALLDSGVDYNHQDLACNVIQGYDFVNQQKDVMDDLGHGTLCAGIINARGYNGIGIVGVSWNCKLMPIKVVNSEGVGSYLDLAEGIIFAVDNGARVITIPLGGYEDSNLLKEAINYALERNCVLVASAGNEGAGNNMYPASYDGVIGVGATDENDYKTDFSNYGAYFGAKVPPISE